MCMTYGFQVNRVLQTGLAAQNMMRASWYRGVMRNSDLEKQFLNGLILIDSPGLRLELVSPIEFENCKKITILKWAALGSLSLVP